MVCGRFSFLCLKSKCCTGCFFFVCSTGGLVGGWKEGKGARTGVYLLDYGPKLGIYPPRPARPAEENLRIDRKRKEERDGFLTITEGA